ncbi:trihelix transcription factor ASIL1-like [Panicum miliaceum]|uniref:Trihelix transcription factor ASIL1-like n=1 Tax=Panicum miliaceum TaxID=4540 RepID=A0A3L6TJD8_PANMI|nr:trihelix transcription factor ASIL1-like [Panicum miliaceum]
MHELFFGLEQLDAMTEQHTCSIRGSICSSGSGEGAGTQRASRSSWTSRGEGCRRGRRDGDLVTPPARRRARAITSRGATDGRALHTVDQCKNGLRAERTRPKRAPPPWLVAVWLGRLRELLQLAPSAPLGWRREVYNKPMEVYLFARKRLPL